MKRSIILFLCIIYTVSASSLLSNYLERTNLEENDNNVLESVISNALERKQKHNLLSSIEGDLLTSVVDSLLNKVLHKKHELRTGKKTRFRRPGFKTKNKILGNKRKRTSYKFSKPKLPLKVRKPKRLKVRNPKLSKHKRFKVKKPELSKHTHQLKSSNKRPDMHLRK